ncbi:MAG: MMPL family transporter, partial [Draconibacterium sp.]|nr:MMPL family transporter [Draconibacterium sp.]
MKRLLTFSANYPWLILTTILVITGLMFPTLSNLKIQISAESLTVEDDPAWIAQQKNLKQFGDSDITVVLFQDENLFTRKKLIVVKDIIDQLIKLPEIQNITSLFNVANIQMVDEYISTKPFIENIPDNDEDLQKILSQARLNPMVIKNLVNQEGTSLALNLVLENTENDPDFDKNISEKVERILTSYQKDFTAISQIGTSYIRNTITKKIAEDQRSIMPWSVVFLVLTLAIGMRSLNGALIPLFTASISIIWTLAGMAVLDIPIGVMTSIIPALLIIIGSTEDIHIIAEYKGNRSKGMEVPVAIDEMSRSIGVAILLTFITTYFGFISIYTNEINLLKEFGLVASSGLLINFFITSLTVPAILKITSRPRGKKAKVVNLESSIYPKLALWIFDFVLRNRLTTAIILIVVGFWSIYGALSLKINNNPLGYFKDDTEIVSSSRSLHENLAGVETFSILLETGIEGTFKKIKYLEELEKIQRYIDQTGHFDKSISFADYMKTIHL